MSKTKVTQYKNFKIQEVKGDTQTEFHVYTNEEWSYGKGFRYAEWEAGTIEEAKEFIDSY